MPFSIHILKYSKIVLQLHKRYMDELSQLNRELTMLQSNMLKEKRRLQLVVDDKTNKIENQRAEIERLMVNITD